MLVSLLYVGLETRLPAARAGERLGTLKIKLYNYCHFFVLSSALAFTVSLNALM